MFRIRKIFQESPPALAAYDLLTEVVELARLNTDGLTDGQVYDLNALLDRVTSYISEISDAAEEHSNTCKRMEKLSATYKDRLDAERSRAFKILDVEDKDKDV